MDYKTIRPEIKTSANIETNVRVGSLSAFATLKLKTKPLKLSVMGVYGENASDMMMIGGYAVSDITDPVDQITEWTTMNNADFWVDMSTNGTRKSHSGSLPVTARISVQGILSRELFMAGETILIISSGSLRG